MKPTISIIVPVYNVEPYIEKCIISILNQTFQDFELILINDGSLDKSGYICECYSKKDDRIVFINKDNAGVSSARNAGLDIAQGEYITFIDSDDSVSEYYLEYLYNLLSNAPDTDFAICNFKRVDTYGNQVGEPLPTFKTKFISIEDSLDCYKQTSGLVWGALYKKRCLTKDDEMLHFNCNIQNSEDNLFTYLIFLNSKKFIRSSKVLYFYLVRDDSAFHEGFNPKKISTLDAQQLMIKYSKNYPTIKNYLKNYYVSNCINFMEQALTIKMDKKEIKRIQKHLKNNILYILLKRNGIKHKIYYLRLCFY